MRTIKCNRVTEYTKNLRNYEAAYIVRKNEAILDNSLSSHKHLVNDSEKESAIDTDSRNKRILNGTFQEFRGPPEGKR